MALKDIKNKIKATQRTHKVTRAMEAVSAVKMRKTQASALSGRAYARAALSILTRLSGTEDVKRHPLAAKRDGHKLALVIITSDKGLAGAVNSSVIKRAVETLETREVKDVVVFAYGKKGEEYFARRGYEIRKSYSSKADDVSITTMEELAEALSTGFLQGDFDKVVTVYSHFKSTFEQVPTMRRLLPLSLPALTEIVEGITPAKGKWSNDVKLEAPASYEIEPNGQAVLDTLIPRLTAISIYHMLLESKASEHSARMVAMKNASDKSKEVAHALTRKFNKIRQAAITREVSEIVGGREALAA
ncbi:MAG TPA: ATP synthase F1 subunit gamma [Candidatus Paceibacterota bacterium]|nr:ATP synthase F1 subunit gamma [Candidatus Paceibacterota bacterium]